MITARKTTTWVLALGLLLALCVLTVLTIGKPASAQDTAGAPSGLENVQPILVDGNPNCATLPDEILPGSHFEFKIEGAPANGTHGDPGSFQVTISNADMKFFDWSSLTGVDAVIVKGGSNADAFVYDLTAESNGDTLLHAPLDDNGHYRDISHVSFCYDGETVVPKPLTATKTATGNYDRTITWKLDKSVLPASHSGEAGASFDSTWKVDATKTEQLGNYKVTGDIKINNPNGFPVDFSVTDELNDTTVADVDCDPNTGGNQDSGNVAANGSATCTYSASPPNKDVASNKAQVTSKTAGVDGTSAEAAITWQENVIGDESVTLADDHLGYSQVIDKTTPIEELDKFTCSSNPADYTDGKYSFTVPNTATLKGDKTDLSANAEVKVDCTLPALTAQKTANGSFDHKISWDLTKTVGPQNTFSGNAGDSFNYTWKVDATKSVVDDNYKVTGKITVTNPAAIDQTFSVTDELDDGTAANVECPSLTVPAKDSVECNYTAASTKDATKNTATVKAPGNQDVEATAGFSYTPNVIGDEKVTLGDTSPKDTPPINFSQEISDSTTKEFPKTFTCPTDPTKYTNFLLTQTNTNTATLKGTNTNLSKSATVTFNCKYPWRAETATGTGDRYKGTANWFMYTKYATTKVDLMAGQNYDAGDIYFTRDATNTYIKITLHNGFRWANVSQNLKIHNFATVPSSGVQFIQPGQFRYKFTVTPQSTVTYTATIPGTTAQAYGIHADVERFVN